MTAKSFLKTPLRPLREKSFFETPLRALYRNGGNGVFHFITRAPRTPVHGACNKFRNGVTPVTGGIV